MLLASNLIHGVAIGNPFQQLAYWSFL
jgi:hypothetical protein